MKINDKYKPLFEILQCWDTIKSPTFKDDFTKKEQEHYISLSKVDTVVVYGGRDSSKTYPIATFIPIAVKDYNHRVLYTRYTMGSTDQSISTALNTRMEDLGISNSFTYASNVYESKKNDGRIFITGQKTSSGNQTAKLKSLEDFSIFVTDEAEEVISFEEWDKVRKSIRAKDVQCLSILIFNPPTKDHWLYTDLFEDLGVEEGFCGVKGNILYIHTCYLDNIENIAEHNLRGYLKLKEAYDAYLSTPKKEREYLPKKLIKAYRKYKHVVLGGFLNTAEGVIYDDWEKGEFNKYLPFVYGMDFGFDDPDVMVKIAIDEKKKLIYVHQVLNKNGLGTNQLAEILLTIAGHDKLIIGDAHAARLINDLYNRGINMRKCKKGHGSVARTINAVKGYTLIVTPESTDIHKALNNYVWHDKRSGVPRNEFKHFPDAIGYGAMELIYF